MDFRLAGSGSRTFLYLLFALCSLRFAFPPRAQQPTKVPRIGYLQAPPEAVVATRTEAFRQGLRDFGYIEGKNIVVEWRYADGKIDRVPALVAELVNLNLDVIVSGGSTVTRSAKEATKRIPTDPLASGFVASLARPGGNITGLATLAPELSGKQLELLKEILPALLRGRQRA